MRTETDYAKAWREWSDSPEGMAARNGDTLQIPLRHFQYLENRINLAFAAGWNARDTLTEKS
jgi:hypothetical protein